MRGDFEGLLHGYIMGDPPLSGRFTDEKGNTLLHLGMRLPAPVSYVAKLVTHNWPVGADVVVNFQRNDGSTALHLVCDLKEYPVVADGSDDATVDAAAARDIQGIVNVLVHYGAKLTIRTISSKQTALHLVRAASRSPKHYSSHDIV